MIATLYVTRDCNLRCEYCYAGRKRSERMAYATAERAVNIALRNSSLIAGIRFFGGEPLLEWDLVKHVTAYAIGEARKQKLLPSFSISTNGTLLNPENLTFFEEHDFAVGVSIDGPPTVHNRNRRTRDGTDSFEQVRASYEALRERDIRHSVELVLDPTTLSELASSVQYLVEELKVRFIIVSLNVFNDWGTDFRSVLTEQYARIADLYLDRFSSDEPFEIDSINNKINVILRGGYDTGRVCRLGRTEITVVPDGRIYACLRLVGWDEEGTT